MNFKQLINHYESLDKKDLIKKLVDKNSLILKQEDEIERLNKRIKEVDERKFMKYLLNSWRDGKDVSMNIGIDGLREVAHSMMIKMAKRAKNKDLASVLLKNPVTPTNILG